MIKLQFHRKYYKLKKERNKKIIRSRHWWISRTIPALLPNCLNCYLDSWYDVTLQNLYITFRNNLFIRIIIGTVWNSDSTKDRSRAKVAQPSMGRKLSGRLTDKLWFHRLCMDKLYKICIKGKLMNHQYDLNTITSKSIQLELSPRQQKCNHSPNVIVKRCRS